MIPFVNHLWQSTLFALVAALLAFLFRRHRASVRHTIWLAASLKFLLPFSLLVSIGSLFDGHLTPPAAFSPKLVVRAAEPFAPVATLPIPDTPSGSQLLTVIPALWITGCVLVLSHWLLRWRRLARVARQAKPIAIAAAPIPVRETDSPLEPGVFGLFRPVLLLPAGIARRLPADQLDAILAHEAAHVQRRDNLTAAIHLFVQALFWFHPLVWWIGSRLVAERENACDEAVLGAGKAPRAYAEGIVNVCKFYLESPLPCAAGVTGADLKQRITLIMTNPLAHSLSAPARVMLSLGGALLFAVPFVAGLAQHPPDQLKYDVASIRESKSENDNSRLGPGPGGGVQAINVPLRQLLTFAYGVFDFQLANVPGWATATRYDVTAKNDPPTAPPLDPKKLTFAALENHMLSERERMRSLLAERFGLVIRRDRKEMPVFALVQAKGGHKLKAVKEGERPPSMRNRNGYALGQSATIKMISSNLAANLGRNVIDETGLTGAYDFEIRWTPDNSADSGASLFTALEEQLGLKLVSKRGPVEIIIVEKLEKPTEN